MRNASDVSVSLDHMLADLAQLVAFDTCFPPAADYAGFCDLLETLAADVGGRTERFEVPEDLCQADGVHGPRVNLLLRPEVAATSDAPEAMIYFHTDTAPIGDGWIRDALKLTAENGRLYGRGTADMKGCIAAVLAAVRMLRDAGTTLRFRPVLAFCTDEEGGLYPGIRHLAETTVLPDVLLNLNGGAEPRIWGGCFGSIDLAVTGQGVAVHSGRPDGGINALEEMVRVLVALAGLKAIVEARVSEMPPAPGEGSLRARLNVTACRAGDKGSALPGTCRLIVNRRYMPEEDVGAVRAEIEDTVAAALADTRLTGWDIRQIGHLPPVVDPAGRWTDRWTRARAEGFGISLEDFTTYGSGTSSDFGWVQKAGIRHMLLGGLMRADSHVHGPDEFTTTDDLSALARSVALFLSADFDPDDQSSEERGRLQSNMEMIQ